MSAPPFRPKQAAIDGPKRRRPRPGDTKIWPGRAEARARAKARGRATRAGRRARGFEVELYGLKGPWVIPLPDARLLVEHIGNAVAVNTYEAIDQGVDIVRGGKRELTRSGRHRMERTGRFRDNIRRTKVTGSAAKAKAKIKSIGGKRGYAAVLGNEAKRQHKYFTVSGTQRSVVRLAMAQFIEAILQGRIRQHRPGMRKAKAMLGDGK